MKPRIIIELLFIIIVLGFSAGTYPVTKTYTNNGSGIGEQQLEDITVRQFHDLIHVEGTISGLVTFTVTDANNDTIFSYLSLSSNTQNIDYWYKLNGTYNTVYHVSYSNLGDYSFEITVSLMGGYWR